MKFLIVHNFGPIKNVELEVKDYAVFIGPQASGKSTIAKLIFFFLSLKEDIKQYLVECIANEKTISPETCQIDIKKRQRAKFVQLFGTTKHMKSFEISFTYDEDYAISLSLKERYVKFHYSKLFDSELYKIFNKVNKCISFNNGQNTDNDPYVQYLIHKKNLAEITSDVNSLFGNDENTVIYVPACRSLLATLSDYIYRLIHVSFE